VQRAAAAGVEENAEELYRRFRPGVRSFFQRKGFSPQECEDLTQDVFLRVFKSIDTFRRESRFERWLWEIKVNIYSNEIRKRRTEKRDAREQSLDAVTETEEGAGPAAHGERRSAGPEGSGRSATNAPSPATPAAAIAHRYPPVASTRTPARGGPTSAPTPAAV